MRIASITILALGLAVLVPSCSFVQNPAVQNKAGEIAISAAVSYRIRSDKNPPRRLRAYAEAVLVLDQYIASGNTSSQELSTLVDKALQKHMSKALSSLIANEIVNAIVGAVTSSDPERFLAAEKLIRDAIVSGMNQAAASSSSVSGDTPET